VLHAPHPKPPKTAYGRAVTVYMHGESGIGKTHLVREFSEDLARSHPAVLMLFGRCYERESVPFKAVDGVIDELSRFLTRLPQEDVAALLPGRVGCWRRRFRSCAGFRPSPSCRPRRRRVLR